jgi:hypothetical protein
MQALMYDDAFRREQLKYTSIHCHSLTFMYIENETMTIQYIQISYIKIQYVIKTYTYIQHCIQSYVLLLLPYIGNELLHVVCNIKVYL